ALPILGVIRDPLDDGPVFAVQNERDHVIDHCDSVRDGRVSAFVAPDTVIGVTLASVRLHRDVCACISDRCSVKCVNGVHYVFPLDRLECECENHSPAYRDTASAWHRPIGETMTRGLVRVESFDSAHGDTVP